MSLVRGWVVVAGGTVNRGAIAAVAVSEKSCDAPDRGDADAGKIVDAAVGKTVFKQFDHLPTIYERLQFRRRTKVLQEVVAFSRSAQRNNGTTQGFFRRFLLAFGFLSIRFHGRIRVSMY